MPRLLISLLVVILAAPAALSEVTLPSVFGDHMVLQRDKEVRIWGKAEPEESVAVQLQRTDLTDQKVYAVLEVADQNGHWEVMLPAHKAEGVWRLLIEGQDKRVITFNDIVFGEVWVASGQSNMSWTVARSANPDEEIADSANDQVRMWTAHRTVETEPADDVPGSWQVASPKTTGEFSAVAYYFARKLQKDLGVPVGILHSSWGGTPVEAWTRRGKLEQIDWAQPILERFDAAVKTYPKAKREYDKAYKRWQETRNGPKNTGESAGYAKPDFDDSDWQAMDLPQAWEKAGINKDGVMWFRKTIQLPDGWAGNDLKLSLGPIDDGDTTYINGTKVGHTDASVRGGWQIPRLYNVPAKLVRNNTIVLAVRVVDLSGAGGIWGKPEQLTLTRADAQGESLSIAGEWRYLFAQAIDASNRPTRHPGTLFGPEHPHAPAGLFNGMIAPILPYTIRGAIWYQGEGNASRAEQYEKLFPGMIEDWRKQWDQGDFPFLFVQLANYRKPTDKVVDPDWAHLRDAQLKTLREVKKTGMAVTIDIGDANDIHPKNKQDVGKRLARWALVDTYGKAEVVKSGPIYQGLEVLPQNGVAFVQFNNFGSELVVRGDRLKGFTIAGEDGKFVVADAELASQDFDRHRVSVVKVWSDRVKQPVAVRYAWEDNPDEANLYNEAGLPASPFRTDDFKGPTDGRR